MNLSTAILVLAISLAAQQSKKVAPKPSPAPPKPSAVGVYYHAWEGGEIKSCFTYEEFASLLSCDSGDKSWEGSIGRVQDRLVAQIHQTFEEKMAVITRDTPNWEAKLNALSEEAKAQIRDITHERVLALEMGSTRVCREILEAAVVANYTAYTARNGPRNAVGMHEGRHRHCL